MTGSGTALEPEDLGDWSGPRRVLAAESLANARAQAAGLAALYADAAARGTPAHLGEEFAALAAAKTALLAELAPLAALLPSDGRGIAPARLGVAPGLGWGPILGAAFQGERLLGESLRELALLLTGSTSAERLTRLAAATETRQARARDLYLRYT